MAPHCTKNFHHNLRSCSSVRGRKGSTRNPASRRAWAAASTAVRVSGVTGTRPSSSKKPMVCPRSSSRFGSAQRNRRACWVGRVLSAKSAKHQLHIGHGARHRANSTENREWAHARRQMTAPRNATRRRLERADAGKVRRHAHRAAAVAAQPRCRHAGCNRRRLAAARSARRALKIPRIAVRPCSRFAVS